MFGFSEFRLGRAESVPRGAPFDDREVIDIAVLVAMLPYATVRLA
jgi:hypothetical protein